MNRTRLLLGFGSIGFLSFLAESGCCVAPVKIGAQAIDDSGEPSVPYVIQFNQAPLKSPADRQAFIDALNDSKVVFRHNMVIVDSSGCDPNSLKDVGLQNPQHFDPCQKMGQQVTQRVGFKNKDNLRAALKHLANQS